MAEHTPVVSRHSRWAAYLIGSLAVAIGVGALVLFAVFLFAGPFHFVDLGLSTRWALVLNAVLCLLFFVQHSSMVRKSMRHWMSQFVQERYLGLTYTFASSAVLIALVVLWQESAVVLASADGALRVTLRAIFFVAVAGSLWGTWSVKGADLFGAEAVLRQSATMSSPAPMIVRGPYRWVRHPIYLTTLLMIWSYPDITADRLLLSGLFSVWMLVGIVLEERDLVASYGAAYRDYQRRVPMLIPYRMPGLATR